MQVWECAQTDPVGMELLQGVPLETTVSDPVVIHCGWAQTLQPAAQSNKQLLPATCIAGSMTYIHWRGDRMLQQTSVLRHPL